MNDELEVLAAEYVLGTLPEDERLRFEETLGRDPAVREAVRQWREKLVPLDDDATAVVPDPRVWRAIQAATGLSSARAGGSAELILLRRKLVRWRAATVGFATLAAGFAAIAYLAPFGAPAAGGRYLAVLDADGQEPALIAALDTETGRIRIRALSAEAPAGHSLELWHVAEGHAPQSLGVLNVVRGEQEIRTGASGAVEGTIAVSVEPTGGSPSGSPTGPIVYSGRLVLVE